VNTGDDRIRIRDLSFHYPATFSGRNITALSHVNLTIGKGDIVLLAGPSGSGKSTLLRCLNGLIPHSYPGVMEGSVEVAGLDTREHEVCECARFIGLVFQDPDYQLFSQDVISELAFGPEQMGWPQKKTDQAIHDAMAWLGIAAFSERHIDELSWGERQRVAIASVLTTSPCILALDEPFSGIDDSSARSLITALTGLNRQTGLTIIIAEHRMERVSDWVNRIVVLEQGAVTFDGSPVGSPYIHNPQLPGEKPCGSSLIDTTEERPVIPGNNNSAGTKKPSLSVENISFTYPGSVPKALDRVTIDFYPGQIVMLIGPNGSGKSTLIRHLNGLLRQISGSVSYNGEEITHNTVAENAKTIGILSQHTDYQLFEETIEKELSFALENLGVPDSEQKTRIAGVTRDLDIDHLGRATPPLGLSAGEKQRVAIGSLLVMETPVIVMDEPTIGLDGTLKRKLASVLARLKDEGRTIIVATHDHEFVTNYADRVIVMSKGTIMSDRYRDGHYQTAPFLEE
jgi:energy-coupling factor transport system ATP-binding protein